MTRYLTGKPTTIDQTVMKPFVVLVPKFIKPNHITFFRLLFTPFVLYLLFMNNYLLGGIWFIFLGLTDALDGSVARLRDEVTKTGRWFDPLADKLLVVFTGALMISKFLNFWIFFALFLVELMIAIKAIYRKMFNQGNLEANVSGKIKMVLQIIGIGFIFIGATFNMPWAFVASFWALSIAILFAILSFTGYNSV